MHANLSQCTPVATIPPVAPTWLPFGGQPRLACWPSVHLGYRGTSVSPRSAQCLARCRTACAAAHRFGTASSSVAVGAKHASCLNRLLYNLVDVWLPDKLCIKGHPKVTSCIEPLCWLSEKLHWSAFLNSFGCLAKEYSGVFWDVDGNLPIP
jgi:hypothetical protein